MSVLKNLKQDMEFNAELSQIIGIFKNIASSEFMRMQAATEKTEEEIFNVLKEVAGKIRWSQYQEQLFLKDDSHLPSAFVALGADEGFSGGLNTLVMNTLLENRKGKKDEFLVLGDRAARYLEEMRESFLYFGTISSDISYARAESLVNFLCAQFKRKKWGRVFFVYAHFISVAYQQIEVVQVLPYRPDFMTDKDMTESEEDSELEFEPSVERVIDYFVRLNLILKVQEMFYSAKLSEYAARIVHLEGSTQQLSEWQKALRLNYYKGLHELRDRNIREIYASNLEE